MHSSEETITEAGLSASKAGLFPRRTICIARCGSAAGRLGMLAIRAATNEAVCGILPSKRLLPKYLFHYLELKRPRMIDSGKGLTQTHISLSMVRSTLIPLAPIEEQRRISKEIDRRMAKLYAGITELEQVQLELKDYRSKLHAGIYEGKRSPAQIERVISDGRPYEAADELLIRLLVDRHPRRKGRTRSDFGGASRTLRDSLHNGRNKGWIGSSPRGLPKIPEGWVWAIADQLCSQITPGLDMRLSYQSAGRPLLAAKNVHNGFIDLSGAGLISEEDFERCPKRCRPVRNDILIVRQGFGIGRAAMIDVEGKFAISNNILLVRPLVDSRFFLNWLQSPFGQDWIRGAAGTGARLTASTLKRMPVPLPPSHEQRRVVEELGDHLRPVNRLDALVDRILKCGQTLRCETLKRAFEGELLASQH